MHQLIISESASREEETLLFEGLNADAVRIKGMEPIRSFALFIKDAEGRICGGATGIFIYGCLYTDMLWIDESLRNQGWGTKLMQTAESMAKEKKCTFATVNTMDWEALPFYQKLGYQIEFVREGFAKG